MHTQRAVMAVQRMISLFQVSNKMKCAVRYHKYFAPLYVNVYCGGRLHFITIRDILLNTNAVANLIRNRKEPQIVSIQETQAPMKTLEMAVRDVKAEYGAARQLHALLEQQLS